jgi:hypothetical protein
VGTIGGTNQGSSLWSFEAVVSSSPEGSAGVTRLSSSCQHGSPESAHDTALKAGSTTWPWPWPSFEPWQETGRTSSRSTLARAAGTNEALVEQWIIVVRGRAEQAQLKPYTAAFGQGQPLLRRHRVDVRLIVRCDA